MIRHDTEKQADFNKWKCHEQTQEKILIPEYSIANHPDNRENQKAQHTGDTVNFCIIIFYNKIFPVGHIDSLTYVIGQIHQTVGNLVFLPEE